MAVNLATAYVEIIPSAKGIGASINNELKGVQSTASQTGSKIGSKLSDGIKSTLKKGALGAGAAAGAVLGRSLQKGFARLDAIEQAQAKFKGLGLSAKESSAVIGDVTAAVKGTAFATSEAADAAAMALAAGVKPGKELTGVLQTIGDTAAFAGKDFAEISPIFTKILNEGRVTGETLAQLGDNAVPAVQALSKELGVSAEEVRKLASEGKISWDEFKAAMDGAIGGSAQAQGETFRGSLKNLDAALGRFGETLLSTPFKMGPQMFSALGASIDDLNTKVKAGIQYLQTGVDTEGYLFKAFGTREQADEVMARLDAVRARWAEFTAGLSGNDAGASGVFGALGSSLRQIGQAASEIMPSVLAIVASLGEAGMTASVVSLTSALAVLAPILADILAPILRTIADLMRENQGAVTGLVTAFVGFKSVNAVAGGLTKVVTSGGKMKKLLASLGPAIKGSASGITGFAKVARSGFASAVRGAQMFKGALQMGQMGRSLKNVSGAAGKLGVALGTASVYAKMAGKALTSGLVKGVKLAITGFKALGAVIAANPIGLIATAVAAVVAGLIYFFTQTETGKQLWASFMEFMGQVWENIKVWARAAWEWIVQVWNGIPEWFGQKWQAVKDAIAFAWEAIKLAIQMAWTAIADWFTATWEGFKQLVGTIWNGIVTVFQTVWNLIKTVVTTVWTGIQTFLVTAWNFIVGVATAIWNGIVTVFQTVWNLIKTVVTTVWNAISSFISGAWASFTSFVQSTWETIKSVISTAWEAIKSAIQAAWEAIKAKVAESVADVKAKIQEFVSTIKSKFDEAAAKVKEFPGKIKNAFSNAGRWLINAGKEIINGLIRGIKSMAGTVGSAIRSILPGAVQGLISLADGGVAYADGGISVRRFAKGGREKHVAQIANAGDWRLWAEPETGGEAYIPLARSKRGRSTAILSDVASIFGLQLVDNDGNRVDATTPGGTGPKGSAVRAFADGGIRTAAQVRKFVEGESVDGVQAERSLQGAPYENYPGREGAWGDCSYTQGIISAFMLGIKPWPRHFSTVSQLNWLRSNGANIGMGPAGSYRVGWYDNGGGQFGHTSGTLPDGTNVEMGGGNGGGAIGGGAVPWNHPQFTHHAWIPAASSSPTVSEDATIPDATASIPTSSGGGAAVGADPNMVPVSDDVAAKTDAAGITDTSSSSTASESTSWSDTIGNWAKTVVSGHVSDILKVFGIPDEMPPLMVAGKKIYVQATKGDSSGKKAEADLEKAADAKLDADATIDTTDVTVEATDATPAVEEATPPQAETVAPGTVTKGEYKLGESFFSEEVARAAASLGMGFEAAKIAWATVLTEAGDPPKMWASSVDTASQQYPYDAIGSDHDSSGLFQQRNNGAWGDISQRMNARASAMMFLNALAKITGWESMDPGAAAQAVQRSAFPSRYSGYMAKAESVMGRFKGKLPGFKKGGMVYGGKGKNLDDVLAWLSNGEMVINSDSVSADPDMAAMLNEQGPDAVKNSVIGDVVGDAVKSAPEFKLSGSMRQMLSQNLHGAADFASQLASAGVSAGFGLAGSGAKALVAAGGAPLGTIPSVGGAISGIAGALPIDDAVGVAGDVASWYTGKVTSGIGHAVADAALGVYDIGASQIDGVLGALGADHFNPAEVAESSGLGELQTVLQDSIETRFGGGDSAAAGGDTFQFIAQDFGQMQSMFRKEQAKRGKVGAR